MLKTIIGVAAFALASTSAHAATFTFVPGGGAILDSETLAYSFDDPARDGDVTGSNFLFLTGTSAQGALPSAGDGSRYLSVLAGGSASLTFAQPVLAFSVDLGSIDSFNTLRIDFVGGGFQEFTGSQLVTDPNGDQIAAAMNGRFRFFADAGQQFAGVTFRSSGNAFEVDRIAITAVPEPASWAMMIGGFALVGAAARRNARPRATLA
jgi:hypothetical protein